MSHHPHILKSRKSLIATASVSGLLVVIFIALGVIGGEDSIEPGQTATAGPAIPPDSALFTVGSQTAANTSAWQGSVRSRQAVQLKPRLSARIVEIPVQPGDALKRGQLIARLDDRDLKAAHQAALAAQQAANAEAEQASSDEKRLNDLYQQQAATRQNYELALARAQSARAHARQAASSAAQAQVMLNENLILAPFDGTVGERYQDPGAMATPGQAIVSFYQPNDLRLETAVAGTCMSRLALNTPVMVRIENLPDTIPGVVDEIAPDLDPITHSRLIKIKLPSQASLQHGQFGWLELSCQEQSAALSIPANAIVHYGQLETVQILDNGRLQTRHVRSGKRLGEYVEILSGLRKGETLVIKGEQQP